LAPSCLTDCYRLRSLLTSSGAIITAIAQVPSAIASNRLQSVRRSKRSCISRTVDQRPSCGDEVQARQTPYIALGIFSRLDDVMILEELAGAQLHANAEQRFGLGLPDGLGYLDKLPALPIPRAAKRFDAVLFPNPIVELKSSIFTSNSAGLVLLFIRHSSGVIDLFGVAQSVELVKICSPQLAQFDIALCRLFRDITTVRVISLPWSPLDLRCGICLRRPNRRPRQLPQAHQRQLHAQAIHVVQVSVQTFVGPPLFVNCGVTFGGDWIGF
jgi:hypothetical protein